MKILKILFVIITLVLGVITFSTLKHSKTTELSSSPQKKVQTMSMYKTDMSGRFGKKSEYFGRQYIIGTTEDALKMYDSITTGWEKTYDESGKEKVNGLGKERTRINKKWNMRATYVDGTESMKKFPEGLGGILTAQIVVKPLQDTTGQIFDQKGDFNNQQVIDFYTSQEAYDKVVQEEKKKK